MEKKLKKFQRKDENGHLKPSFVIEENVKKRPRVFGFVCLFLSLVVKTEGAIMSGFYPSKVTKNKLYVGLFSFLFFFFFCYEIREERKERREKRKTRKETKEKKRKQCCSCNARESFYFKKSSLKEGENKTKTKQNKTKQQNKV